MEIQNWKMEGGVLTRLPNKVQGHEKAEGFMLVSAALASLVWILIAQCAAVLTASSINDRKTSRLAEQAEMYGNIEIEKLKNTSYSDIATQAHARQTIPNVGDGNWESEVTIGDEQSMDNGDADAKMRIAHIAIYRKGDTSSRFSVDIPVTTYGVITSQGDKHGSIIYTGGHYSLPAGVTKIYVEGEPVELNPNQTPYIDSVVSTVTGDSNALSYHYTGKNWIANWGSGGVFYCEYALNDNDVLKQDTTRTVSVYFGDKVIYTTSSSSSESSTVGEQRTISQSIGRADNAIDFSRVKSGINPSYDCEKQAPSDYVKAGSSSQEVKFHPGIHISW